ncbi:ABC transporter ATP-binding protein [Actinotalea sp. AC32]|nr:ABC transporter ATP-binding protein [Actinotalea sp. AC32]
MTAVLEVEHLSASIGGQLVVEDVSFSVPATGVTAVLGRNGVGKTSTIKAVLGLIDRSGTVRLDGERVDREPTHRIVRRGVGYVPEDREVFTALTVEENLRLAVRDAQPRRRLVEELFPDLLRRSAQRAGTLSGGQQQMLSMARALLNDNRILLVDEPTKGLAPKIVTELAVALEEAARTVPVLLVEQNLQVIERLAQDVVVIDAGRVVHTGPARELLADDDAVRRLLGVHSDAHDDAAREADTHGQAAAAADAPPTAPTDPRPHATVEGS